MTDHHRDEFEAWYRKEYPNAITLARFKVSGLYAADHAEATWHIWQESRRTYRASVLEEAAKACEIEYLVEPQAGTEDAAYDHAVRDCADAIRQLATQKPGCRGTACGTTTGEHSAECVAEHAKGLFRDGGAT